MKRNHWLTLLLSGAGLTACILGISAFVWTVFSNNLPWTPNISPGEYYLDIGNAFGDGFIMGFFLCFFLVLIVVTLATMLGLVRERHGADEAQPERSHLRIVRQRRT
jgi:uncharacterized membrane protein